MKLQARIIVCAFLTTLFSHAEITWAQTSTFTAAPPPTVSTPPNDVYGLVNFSLTADRRGVPIKDAVRALMESLAPLLSKQGDYILTVEVLSDANDVIARKAIIQATREEKGFLIFNRVLKQSSTTEWYGNILDTKPIAPANNNVRIKIRSYYSKQTKFDLDTFNLISDLVAKAGMLELAPDLQKAWQPVATQVQTLLSSYEQQDISDIASFSFVKFSGDAFPQSGTFTRKFERDETVGTVPYEANVKIQLEPIWARVVTLKGGKVEEPFYLDVLAAARIGDVLIETVLGNSKDQNVKKLLASFQSDKGYEAVDIGDKCQAVYQELAQSFTRTDAIATYWALAHRYDRILSLNKDAKDCLDSQLRSRMTALGLPTNDLRFLGSGGGAVAAATPEEAVQEASSPLTLMGGPPLTQANEGDTVVAQPSATVTSEGSSAEEGAGAKAEEQAGTGANEDSSATYEVVPLDSSAPLQ